MTCSVHVKFSVNFNFNAELNFTKGLIPNDEYLTTKFESTMKRKLLDPFLAC